jgi:cytoskeletal protein CcmA (bactofilin family)
MFQKNMISRDPGHEPETIIASSVKVEGDFSSQGNVLIEGVVEGSLRTERDLRVGERAVITADVSAANATVAGEVRGNIVCAERLELEATARVMGDVRTKVLVVTSGATLNGRIAMGAEAVVPEKKSRLAAKSSEAPAAAAAAVEMAKAAKAAEKSDEPEKEKRTVAAFFTR